MARGCSAMFCSAGRVWSALLVLFALQWRSSGFNWQDNLRPKLFCSMTPRDYTSFVGNLSAADAFTTLYFAESPDNDGGPAKGDSGGGGGNLLIGARNIMYKLTASELRLTQTLHWHSSDFDRESCSVKGKEVRKCQNYLSVIQQYGDDPNRFLICGTNAFKPMCREYVDERGSYVMRSERSGLGLAPFDPDHNSTALLVGEDLFAGTVADLSGVDPIIFRKPLRTQQYDPGQLNSPDFVGSFSHGDHVYFFFREGAVEHTNCGKAVFARVARVCKRDMGGPNKARYSWTSYLKARLNCSVPGEYPFYFDDIQGVTPLVRGKYGSTGSRGDDLVLYATFSTPVNSIGASAVCAFRLRDISDAFAGRFKEQGSVSANWLPVEDHKVPSPRPGMCLNDSKSLPDINLNFIRNHVLMDDTVPAFFGAPVIVRTGLMSRFTAIAVDAQVKTTEGKAYDVIFVGTTNGRVIKAINAQSADSAGGVAPVIIEELQVFSVDTAVKSIQVIGSGSSKTSDGKKKSSNTINKRQNLKSLGQLAVMSAEELRSFPVQRCERASGCEECVALQDPYCAWDLRSARCSSGDWTRNMASSFLQSISTGHHAKCGGAAAAGGKERKRPELTSPQTFSYERHFGTVGLGQIVNIIDDKNRAAIDAASETSAAGGGGSGGNGVIRERGGGNGDGNGVQVVEPSQVLFSLETLVITVSAGAVAALVVGFVTGYCCGRRCGKDAGGGHAHVPYPDTEYEYFEHRGGMARPMVGPPGPGPGAPLLPPVKYPEEVTYAEPQQVMALRGPPPTAAQQDHLTMGTGSAPQPPRFPAGGLSSLPQPSPSSQMQPGMLPPQQQMQHPLQQPGGQQPQLGGYSSSLLNHANKFNTIHGNKRGPGGGGGSGSVGLMNDYESAAEARLGSGKDPALFARGRDNFNSYHMSTLGRTGSGRQHAGPPMPTMGMMKEPMLPRGQPPDSTSSSNNDNSSSIGNGGGERADRAGGAGGGGVNPGCGGKGQQVTDSAYGTTRSVKNKVYL